MAYQLRYYKNVESHGHIWRLEIHRDTTNTISAVEIGPVLQGLKLIVQGNQADVDTPIVKTSLEMVFVDAPGLEYERKCGYWEEFYTSSATEYMVILRKDGVLEWSGYITPDSFSEDLRYRGSVTIIARDNLGALQDYEYDMSGDANGLVKFRDLVEEGLRRISFGMAVKRVVPSDPDESAAFNHKWPYSLDGFQPSIYNIDFNSNAFYGQNWWEVIEDTMYSLGVTLRYIGKNRFAITPIRNIGMMGETFWSDVVIKDARFVAHGRRELSPAAKAIKEEVSFDIVENIADFRMPANNYGAEGYYDYLPDNSGTTFDETERQPVHAVMKGWDTRTADKSLMLNVFAYSDKKEYRFGKNGAVKNMQNVYLACNEFISDRSASFRQRVLPGKYSLQFDVFGLIGLYDNKSAVGFVEPEALPTLDNYNLLVQFIGDDGSVWSFKHISGGYSYEWVNQNITTGMELTGKIPYTQKIQEFTVPSIGYIVVGFSKIYSWRTRSSSSQCEGLYLGINNIQIIVTDNEAPIMNKLSITTEYNNTNNIILTHRAQYAPNPSNVVSPRLIRNAIYIRDTSGLPVGSERWVFREEDAPQPLSVLIHQQMLAYYAKPNNVLSGELYCENGESPDFSSLWRWNGKEHILMSGSLNILTGRMESAVLREFARYEDMWEA